jgi:hypothetical protein
MARREEEGEDWIKEILNLGAKFTFKFPSVRYGLKITIIRSKIVGKGTVSKDQRLLMYDTKLLLQ